MDFKVGFKGSNIMQHGKCGAIFCGAPIADCQHMRGYSEAVEFNCTSCWGKGCQQVWTAVLGGCGDIRQQR